MIYEIEIKNRAMKDPGSAFIRRTAERQCED
jgi:hypothetical protein